MAKRLSLFFLILLHFNKKNKVFYFFKPFLNENFFKRLFFSKQLLEPKKEAFKNSFQIFLSYKKF